MDAYYDLARRMPRDRQSLAAELEKLHRQTVDQVIENVFDLLDTAEHDGWSVGEIRKNVREIEGRGIRFAHDRMHLRRCEAVLAALRERKALIVPKREVARAYDDGDGVEISNINDTAIEVQLHPGKYRGE